MRCLDNWSAELRSCGSFTILTDHRNLEYFMTRQKLTERQSRWAAELSQFDFKLEYRPGCQAAVPDALSRREQDKPQGIDDEREQGRMIQLIPDDAIPATTRARINATSSNSSEPPGVANGQKFPFGCIYSGRGSAAWNCTFNNTFSQGITRNIVGQPEVHWDDESDLKLDSRYIRPNRVDNIWASFGAGGGSAAMMQVFTVTKKTRRHTFVESVFRATMLTSPGVPFATRDVEDLVRRTWSANETDKNNPLIGQIVEDITSAQAQNLSYHFGVNAADNGNLTVLQSSWGYFTVTNSHSREDILSLIIITGTNITLIRSETIDKPPTPFEKCDHRSFQNEAFGGRIAHTDCASSQLNNNSSVFYGQVDTAAVLVLYGLGNRRSNVSSDALDNNALSWTRNMWATMQGLLVARGYIVSVDPALVTISVNKLIVAMSGLQLLLSMLAVVLAGAAWLALACFADAHWSNTFLSSFIHTTTERDGKKSKPGFMHNPPRVELLADGGRNFIAVSGKAVILQDPFLVPMDSPK
ncbi:hypothetical protein HIM_11653 [Hirsutella minnesotensis 3608]|uniref:Reverse transcriptase RNase H-like domain-containing protein n=1 Tax=Hirsutella minnesotensis 3608 TaxID=1043627 RepID=A0A0F7ZFD6_9HYPO|nr:hypothetical protein HIM_11653 [Hirsutella minnesotensis 3608]